MELLNFQSDGSLRFHASRSSWQCRWFSHHWRTHQRLLQSIVDHASRFASDECSFGIHHSQYWEENQVIEE